MWTESKKWRELRASGGHGVVRFDVFCGHCNKQLGENLDSEDFHTVCFQTDAPMETFCDFVCAAKYQATTGKVLLRYGWSNALGL